MAYYFSSYTADGAVTLGLWARISGTWTKVGTAYAYSSGTYDSGGLKTLYYSISQTVSASGAVDAFRVTVDSNDSGTGYISNINSVTWQTQTSSGTRSATPNGEKIIATVRPQ